VKEAEMTKTPGAPESNAAHVMKNFSKKENKRRHCSSGTKDYCLSLLLSGGLGSGSNILGSVGGRSGIVTTLGLEVVVVNAHGLINLVAESSIVGGQVKKLGILHLEEHTSDLACELGLLLVDLGVESLTEHLLLLSRGSSVESVDVERRRGRSGLGALLREATHLAGTTTAELLTTTTHVGATHHVRRHTTGHHGHGSTTTSTATTHHHLLSKGGVGVCSRREALHGRNGVTHGGLAVGTAATALLGETTTLSTLGHTLHEGHLATGGHDGLATRTEEHLGLHELRGDATGGGSLLLHADLVASLDAGLELTLADVLALGESDVEGLVMHHLLVELGDGLGGLVWVAEADKAKALALAEDLELAANLDLVDRLGVLVILLLGLDGLLLLLLLISRLVLSRLLLRLVTLLGRVGVTHNLGRGDLAVRLEDLAELVIVNVVGEVLDVQVHALVLVDLLLASGLVLAAELLLTLVLLLCASDVQLLAVEVKLVKLVNSLVGVLVSGEVDEAESAALAVVVVGERGRGDVAILLKQDAELVVGNAQVDVLDIDVGEVGLHLLELAHAVLLGDVVADKDLLLVQEHTVDALDGSVGSLCSLVVDETVSLGVAVLVLGDLAGKNVAKGGKGVVQSLVVNGDIEVLDEDIALASLAEGGVTLGPHDTAGSALDEGVVQLLESALTVIAAVVVDVRVTERTASDGVTADTDRGDLADRREELEEHGLGDRGVELTDIEGSRVGGLVLRSLSLVASRGVGTVDVGRGRGGLRRGDRGGGGLNVRHVERWTLLIFCEKVRQRCAFARCFCGWQSWWQHLYQSQKRHDGKEGSSQWNRRNRKVRICKSRQSAPFERQHEISRLRAPDDLGHCKRQIGIAVKRQS
jgi:hypothetical protein